MENPASEHQEAPDNPTSEELDVEGPNESAPGHQPEPEDEGSEPGSDPPGSD